MYIAIKDTKVIAIHETEWQCRRHAKGLDKPAYWTWLATVTSEDENGNKSYDFSGEDYEIVETDAPLSYESTDDEGNAITVSFNTSGHIHSTIDEGTCYHLKWDATNKVIVKDDVSLEECNKAQEWKSVRQSRNRRLAETDYLALSDNTLTDPYKAYRDELRQIPQTQTDPFKITWPVKPT